MDRSLVAAGRRRVWRRTAPLPMYLYVLTAFIFTAFLLFSAAPVFAEGNVRFEHILKENGLSSLSVSSIVQDERGFLWFGTQSGLNRYDGYDFKVYKKKPFDANSLSHDLIQTLYMDEDHVLWVGTYNGLNRLDTLTGEITRYLHDPDDPTSLSDSVVVSILRDKRGDLWVGTLEGLNRLDEESGDFTRYLHDPDNPESISDSTIRDIYEDPAGRLWIGTYGGLNRYDREGDRFTAYQIDPERNGGRSSSYVMAIDQSRAGELHIGTWGGGGLFSFDIDEKRFYSRPLPDDRSYSLNSQKEGTLLVGTWGDGLVEVDTHSGEVRRQHRSSQKSFSISHNIVYSLFRDDSGILWIGTNGGGINKMLEPENEFTYFDSDPENPDSLSEGKVNAILRDSRETLWIGTYNGGLNRYDADEKRMIHYQADRDAPHSLSNDIVTDIFEDSSGTLWVSTNDGLNRYDRKRDRFDVFHKGEPPFRLKDNIVYMLEEDEEGQLWIGTYSAGVTRYDPKTGEAAHYSYDPADPHSLSDNLVYDLLVDSDGTLWVGTNNGLNRYDKEIDGFQRFYHEEDDRSSLTSNTIRELYEDSRGTLWVGTISGGLLRYEESEAGFDYYMGEQGLPDNNVYGILEDYRGRLWISSTDSLTIFSPEEEHFQVVDEDNGIWAQEFTRGHARDGDGRLYFGTTEGVYRIVPSDFRKNMHVPPVYLTSINIFDKAMEVEKPLSELDSVSITHEDRYISFEFTALDYVSPEKNEYAYRLEGFDKEWVYSGNRRYASYTNLPPGNYTFRVKASNNDNVWNEDGRSLELRVIPPPWRTGWAYAGYGLALALLIAGVALSINREQKRRYVLQTQELERRRLSELEREVKEKTKAQRETAEAKEEAERADRAKSDFIANISHEIRTPMNAIIGYTQLIEDEVKDPALVSFVRIIQRSGRQLLALINELLDLSIVEAGKLKVHPTVVDVHALLDDTAAVYSEKAKEKEIELSMNIEKGTPRKVILDEMRIRQVLYNLIGNALKFTERGSVRVTVSAQENEGSVYRDARTHRRYHYRFSIRDTGIGIPEEQQVRIFEAFTQREGQSARYGGTGLGLAISKRLVEAMGGELQLESREGGGSTFTVDFPSLPVDQRSDESTSSEGLAGVGMQGGEKVEAQETNEAQETAEGPEYRAEEHIPFEFDFSGETADIRNALVVLEGELKERWLRIAGAVFIEEWGHFAEKLYSVGEEYRLSGLRRYAQMILDNVRDFHIQELKELVGSYPALVLQYRRRVE